MISFKNQATHVCFFKNIFFINKDMFSFDIHLCLINEFRVKIFFFETKIFYKENYKVVIIMRTSIALKHYSELFIVNALLRLDIN
jgi:hypothetical protein